MIDPKELRIGNYVEHPDTKIWKWQFSRDDYDAYEMNRFNPIPLTVEWMGKFNLKKMESNDFIDAYWIRNLLFIELERNFVMIRPYIIVSRCEYVHQLQNLYFALTGKELV